MAQLTYLEDPPNGQSPVSVMVLDEAIESLKMYCRGGTNCCGKEDTRICADGEGDCDDYYIVIMKMVIIIMIMLVMSCL